MACDVDIEPEDLVPEYVATKIKLLELTRRFPKPPVSRGETEDPELAIAKLDAKLQKIEGDVLFDKASAEMIWKSERVVLEKQLAAARKETQDASTGLGASNQTPVTKSSNGGDVAAEAERMTAEILAETNDGDSDGDDYNDITGLFASLPQNEVDPDTGKTQTVINAPGGPRMLIRDFGKWTGVSPRRVLEEACRSR